MSLNTRIIKLASITQNNHVYEHTAESLTPKVLLNVKSPYRRQKRDFSIIRLLFRRFLYTGIEILAINTIIFLPTTSTISYFLPFYFLAISSIFSYLFTTASIISYLPIFLSHYWLFFTFLRPHRLFLIFLSSCDRLFPTFLFSYFLPITSTISYLSIFLRSYRLPTTDIHIVNLSKTIHTRLTNQNRARFVMPKHNKSSN
jgi:hypothetical protein